MELKSWDSLDSVKLDAKTAIAAHDEAIKKLYRNGKPIYSDEIMREHAKAARATLTAALDRCAERAQAFQARAEAKAADGQGDPYTWLTTEELQRAALLRPFIAEDAAAAGVEGIATLSMQVSTGKRQLDRVEAWLYMREAEKFDGAPTVTFMRAAMPPEMAAADQEAQAARSLQADISQARPEYMEHLKRDVMGYANYDHTGQLIDA